MEVCYFVKDVCVTLIKLNADHSLLIAICIRLRNEKYELFLFPFFHSVLVSVNLQLSVRLPQHRGAQWDMT